MPDELIGADLVSAFEIAVVFVRPTSTVIGWAKRGLLPGAVFVGSHVWFKRDQIQSFIEAGGTPKHWPKTERFTVARHNGREHASGRPQNDRIRKLSDNRLAALVKPDPGLRDAKASDAIDYSGVEPHRLLSDTETPDLGTITHL